MYNDGISNFYSLLLIKRMMDIPQILQGLSYKVCPTISLDCFAFGLFILVFEISIIIGESTM